MTFRNPQADSPSDPKQESLTRTRWEKIGCCYAALAYLLYWPAIYAVRAGAEWSEINVDWGDPQVYALMWLFAPVVTPLFLFVAVLYWVVDPVCVLITRVFW